MISRETTSPGPLQESNSSPSPERQKPEGKKAATSDYKQTPMMRQYFSMKEKHPQEILFFRMGDFYEMFFDDAKVASRMLGLTLTARNKEKDPVPMAGIPVKALDSYLPRLLKAGQRVAICEQIQDPKEAKGIVERDVVRVISPGTITDEKLIGEKSNNFLAALILGKKNLGLAWIDISTGEFVVWEEIREEAIYTELSRLSPSECVLPESLHRRLDEHSDLIDSLEGIFLTPIPDWAFDNDTAYRTLTGHFKTKTLEGYGCEHYDSGIRAAGGLLHYVKETQKNALGHLTSLRPFPGSDFMLLDRATRQALEITHTNRGGDQEGSLLSAIDRTVTALGARKLREWILKPLRHVERIHYRQEAVAHLVREGVLLEDLSEQLKHIHDLERICSRISYGSANARDLVALRTSLKTLPVLSTLLEGTECRFFSDSISNLGDFEELVERLDQTLIDTPPMTVREGGIIRKGFDAELDRLRDLSDKGTQWLAEFQAKEQQETGIPKLKIGFNKVFGYYIEITNTHSDKIPEKYIRKQTLKNCERYITPELKDFENEVLHARDNAMDLEYEIFRQLREAAQDRTRDIQLAARAVASLDVVQSFSSLAVERNYVRPEVNEGMELDIVEGRHPVLDLLMADDEFVANSIDLSEKNPLIVLTGPNMAGKSTYIRQVALLTLLAHTGSFIPAERAEIGLVDRIFTRVGSADDISRGQSTFMVEMHETANIVNNATERSLLVLDEVGRGTSTFDGISLAWAVTEHIAGKLKARTLFATHYHELTELSLVHPEVRNYTFSVKEWNDSIVFLRKVIEGAADKSYGIHVARLAGLPKGVLDRARQILSNLETQSLDLQGQPAFAPPLPKEEAETSEMDSSEEKSSVSVQLDLFQDANQPILKELKKLKIESMTPIDALNYLAEIRDRIV